MPYEYIPPQIRLKRFGIFRPLALAVPFATLGAVALQAKDPWIAVGTATVVAVAAATMGAGLGFLFGIPRSLQEERSNSGPQPDGTQNSRRYEVNTNLEQISDWLTKILVGIGLVQLGPIARTIGNLITEVGAGLAPDQRGRVIAAGVMFTYAPTGFLIGYVSTRTWLATLFAEYDDKKLDKIQGELLDIRRIVDSNVGERFQADGDAMRLVLQQLDYDEPDVDESALRNALRAATPSARANVLLLADEVRRKSWRDPAFQGRVERTVPIFRSLTELGPANHRYWAALGYAYKDSAPPNNSGALAALTRAIERRGDPRTTGKEFYEFARALVRIRLLDGKPADERTQGLIRQDVAAAWHNETVRRIVQVSIDKAPEGDDTDKENCLLAEYIPTP
ncbi:hypothetical protein Lfu02_80220 [Longispora fulva]|uniref:Uncharacterized protein n=1 Tax=Longispora fulva TaxID=619741 RepID=A0A8J7GIY7_9ACTN|nr:hypothetical protein [Longispora fulva]MBG6138385.1 hypothetical protein [Longispora fulva]GIG63650.1 hypothetical protein Lfu02_80220 [Longispora fulva]